MSSADPGDEEQQGGDRESPPAEEITDPALKAEVDNPADANPTVPEATPGADTTAADAGPVPAPGAPGELSSDQTPSQGQERGAATPSQGLGDVPGGDAGAPESGGGGARPTPAASAVPPSARTGTGAVVPQQPAPTSAAAAQGAAVERAVAGKAAQSEGAAGGEVSADPGAVAGGQDAAAQAQESPAEVDQARERLVEALRESLGDAVVGSHVVANTDVWVRVDVDAWADAARVCRDTLGLRYFCYLSAVDWLPSPYGRSEDAGDDATGDGTGDGSSTDGPGGRDLEHGYAGGESRFQLIARYVSPETSLGLTVKADLADEAPRAPTVSDVYAGADWHERETWEMYGVDFTGHPNLAHLYLPGAFEGNPQRKDFPLLAREVKPWPGLVDVEAMPGEVSGDEEEPAS